MNTLEDTSNEATKPTELGSELDELLRKAVERQEALKMPKPKLHWKQLKQKRLEARRRHERTPGQVAYVNRQRVSLRRRYTKLRNQMKRQGTGFELSYEDWVWAWLTARHIAGAPAWKYIGRGKGKARMERLDRTEPYRKDNVQITYGKEILWP